MCVHVCVKRTCNERILLLHSRAQLLQLGNHSVAVVPVLLHLIEQPVHLLLVPLHLRDHLLALGKLALLVGQTLKLVLPEFLKRERPSVFAIYTLSSGDFSEYLPAAC